MDAERAQLASKWFAESERNVRAAKRLRKPGLEPLAIFHLQQALEMSVKALAAASGYTHEDLKTKFGHNIADLYLSLFEDVLERSGLVAVVNEVLSVFYKGGSSYDAFVHLSDARDHLASPRSGRAKLTDADWRAVFLSAFRISADEVDQLVSAYDAVKRDGPLAPGALVLLREQMALARGVPAETVSPKEVNREFDVRFPSVRPLLGLFIFGCIFWPHNMPTRYPAHPEADSDVFRVGQFGMLGARHYSADLGVVKRLRLLLECCEEIVEGLIDAHRRGRLFITQTDVTTN